MSVLDYIVDLVDLVTHYIGWHDAATNDDQMSLRIVGASVCQVGTGAYASVWASQDEAFKCFRDQDGPIFLHVFLREGLLLRLGYGPRLTGVVVRTDGTIRGLGMQLGVGSLTNWRDLVPSLKTCELNKLVPLVRDIAVALQDLHSAGILHGDVKPSNAVIMADGTAKLCDFGLSCPYTGPYYRGGPPEEIYTVTFRPPELLPQAGHHVGPECDVWAFGAMLYVMLFEAPSLSPDSYTVLEAWRPAVPDNYEERLTAFTKLLDERWPLNAASPKAVLATVMARCLDWNPSNRPTMRSIATILMDVSDVPRFKPLPTQSTGTALGHVLSVVDVVDVVGAQTTEGPTTQKRLRKASETAAVICKNLAALAQLAPLDGGLRQAAERAADILMVSFPDWTNLVAATVASVAAIALVRPMFVLQLSWCSRVASVGLCDIELALLRGIVPLILEPSWASSLLEGFRPAS